jgi:uncharacterized membrane protein
MQKRTSIIKRAALIFTPILLIHFFAVFLWSRGREKEVWCSVYDGCSKDINPFRSIPRFYSEVTGVEVFWYHIGAVLLLGFAVIVWLILLTVVTYILKGRAPRIVAEIGSWFDEAPPVPTRCNNANCPCVVHEDQTFVTEWRPRN